MHIEFAGRKDTTMTCTLPTVVATEPHLFHAVESDGSIEVYVALLVEDDDEMWTRVRSRLAGRPFTEMTEQRRDPGMMFGQAKSRAFTF
ncbi:hypothetical protein [Pseudonocardia hydrocarbonoxydans]|uniref:Uncharacterized protein n=1 Tax=Pseudonocardia hydrocarbonoxydans TaxID=76726 RepID=A0A4Y3WXP7_9PSEU|nr:hypothetical protein [Pseudonocardia hydrocarbonoxydans]GEC22216.1 hypothetical protein PHY01_44990 [Pseudonocardia hydrocarbonoxydans]